MPSPGGIGTIIHLQNLIYVFTANFGLVSVISVGVSEQCQ